MLQDCSPNAPSRYEGSVIWLCIELDQSCQLIYAKDPQLAAKCSCCHVCMIISQKRHDEQDLLKVSNWDAI